ncbi:MAG: sigma 54-interacting transcriptional regulator [Nitrospira sp.]|nr:sigma 54-interacting transcriptional regulator [Nitrospira sp.]
MNREDSPSKITSDTILDSIAGILPNAASVQRYLDVNSETILNSIADGIVVIGLDHRILFINRAAEEMLGRPDMEVIITDKKCNEVISHTGCTMGCLINTTIETGEPVYNYEAFFERKGRKLFLSINTALLRDGNNEIIGGIETFRDITLIKELHNELKNKYSFENIIGKDQRMHEVYELIREVAPTKATVLIEGETGTGKELIANAIHLHSPRNNRPFVKATCAVLSEGLLESELFGHVKGAFTGAITDKTGRFELANHGTIFLDEIGDVALHTQIKLLRVLQEGELERVGDSKTIKVDVRVIAATNRDLRLAVEKGEFREDLYYRLKVVPVQVPPLRERKDDIPLLLKHFIEKFNKEMGAKVSNISPAAMEFLMEYNYPGNIRELEHIIEYAIIRCHGTTINPEHLPKDIQNKSIIDKVINKPDPLRELEREFFLRLLNETNWNYQECARRLNMSRTTLWRRLKALNVEKENL